MLSDLTAAIFKADIGSSVNSFRQNLQIEYTRQLIEMVSGKEKIHYMNTVIASAVYQLKEIKKMATAAGGDLSTQAHKEYLSTIITNALRELK
ncbi:MAG: hypothetical protein MUF75_08790 [Bacteroidia bacterium]|nr:hypothetical protein [Bacteroidia bacterium]